MKNQRQVSLVCGQTGSGKTRYAVSQVAIMPRALILDAGFKEFSSVDFSDFSAMIDELSLRSAFSDPAARFNFSYTPYPDEYDLCFRLAWAVGNLTLVLEESDRFDELSAGYSDLIVRGRHRGVSLFAIAPHPFNFPKDLRRQLTKVVSFRQSEESDLAYLADVVGPDIFKVRDFTPEKFSRLEWTPTGGVKLYDAD